MKISLATCSILINVALGVGIIGLVRLHQAASVVVPKQAGVVYNIAVLTPTTHPSLEKIEKSFAQELAHVEKATYRIKVYNANGDRILMRAQAEEALGVGHDLIFAIATQPAQLIHELIVKKQSAVPFVFAAVSDPVKAGVVPSLETPDAHGTGVVEVNDFAKQLELLRYVKPDAKRILLVYHPAQGGGLEQQKLHVQELCTSMGFTFSAVEVYQMHEVYTKMRARVADADVVMVLKDNMVVSAIDGLIKLCNVHGVTLYATDLDSGIKGAALSFGVQEEVFGRQGAMLVRRILEDKQSPSTLACVPAKDFSFQINLGAAATQGLTIQPDLLQLLKVVKVIPSL